MPALHVAADEGIINQENIRSFLRMFFQTEMKFQKQNFRNETSETKLQKRIFRNGISETEEEHADDR